MMNGSAKAQGMQGTGRGIANISRHGLPGACAALARLLLAWCALVAGIPSALAGNAGAAPAPWPVLLHPQLETTEDVRGALTLQQVRALGESAWHAAGPAVPSFGFSESAWWLRLRLHNDTDLPVQRVIEMPQPVLDYVDLYLTVQGQEKPLAAWRTGDRTPFSTRAAAHPNFAFPVTLEPRQTVHLYVRLATYDGLHEAAPMRMWDYRSFFEHAADERLVFGLYYGGLLALLLYNLFLFASTRERLFAEYVAYLGAFFLWNFSFRGFGFQYLWPEHPDFNNQILAIAAGLSFVTHTIFTIHYLQTQQLAPRLHRLLVVLLALQCLSLMPPLAGIYAWSWVVMIPLSLISLASFMLTAAVLLRRGSRSARYYLLSWSVLEVGVMLYYLRLVGILPSSVLTEQGLQIGSALEFVLLAFGLADRMNELKAAKLQAEREALEAKSAMASRLEAEVQERTQQLQTANDRLAAMAITDELTGAYNRRHFNEVFDAELRRQVRSGEGLAIAMLDIDYFKAYNDRYGHQQGDEALKAVSRCVQGMLRRSGDRLFRLGGEEFGVLLQVDDPLTATAFVESIVQQVAQLGIEHAGSPHGCVTVSAGLLYTSAHTAPHDAQALYIQADALLYQAKVGGRNTLSAGAYRHSPAQPVFAMTGTS